MWKTNELKKKIRNKKKKSKKITIIFFSRRHNRSKFLVHANVVYTCVFINFYFCFYINANMYEFLYDVSSISAISNRYFHSVLLVLSSKEFSKRTLLVSSFILFFFFLITKEKKNTRMVCIYNLRLRIDFRLFFCYYIGILNISLIF